MDLNEISRAGRFDLSDFRSLTAKNRLVQTGTLGGGILARDIYPATDATDPLTLDYFGGTSGTYVGYDRFGRVTRNEWTAGTATRSRYDYTYDRASNRLTRANGIDADFDETYTYDDLHRLATMTRRELGTGGTPARTEDWTLDAVGNWKEFDIAEDGSATLEQTRSVNNANELTGFVNTTGASWASPGYDAAGGMTAVPSPLDMTAALTAKYDAWNRLTELRDAASNLVAEYQYDAKNRRIRKVMADETYYDYYHDTGVRILEIRRNGDTDPLKQYIWSQRYLHSPVLRFRDADTDGQDIQVHYYLTDANFNVTALADAAGEVIERYVYTPYGQRTLFNADYNSPAVYDNDIAFTGYRLDIESGLYYAPYRYQHPVLGLFITRDPLGYVDGMNLYGYVGNRPVGWVDPFGLILLPLLLEPAPLTRVKTGAPESKGYPYHKTEKVQEQVNNEFQILIGQICRKGKGEYPLKKDGIEVFFGPGDGFFLASFVANSSLKYSGNGRVLEDEGCSKSCLKYELNLTWEFIDTIDAHSFEELFKYGGYFDSEADWRQRMWGFVEGSLESWGVNVFSIELYDRWTETRTGCCE